MTSWRLDLTVLVDLSASMFAACFMVLLIFLSLVQSSTVKHRGPIDATQALRLVSRPVETPAGLVDLLYAHDGEAGGTSIDIFADRIELINAAGQKVVLPAQIAGSLGHLASPLRLYVFSNALYNHVAATLEGARWREMSIPEALRDPAAPDRAWTPGFRELEAQHPDPESFRRGLAQLLNGGTAAKKVSGGNTSPQGGGSADLLPRLTALLSFVTGLAMPTLGAVAVVVIERRRWRELNGLDKRALREQKSQGSGA